MPKITYIEHDGTTHTVEAELGSTVMESALKASVTECPIVKAVTNINTCFQSLSR